MARPDVRQAIRRLPLRLKLTLAYALVVAVALAAAAGVVFLRFESELNQTIDGDLRSRAQALAALVAQQGPEVVNGTTGERLLRPQGVGAQILRAPRGTIVAATPTLSQVRILGPDQTRTAARHGLLVARKKVPGVGKRARFAADPVPRNPGLVVVVGRSLKDREGANESFARALLIGGPLALLFASLAGYGLAAAALRPVERMRRRAASISSAEPGARLPVPDTDDELGRLGRTLNEMLERLERAFAAQRVLTANASHELRTPLAVLSSTLEVALRHARSPEDTERVMREALAEAQRLSHLADELLLLARLEEQSNTATKERVAVDTVVDRVVERMRETAAIEGRFITANRSELTVPADPMQLEQALENLVSNAIVHGQGAIRVHVAHEGNCVAVHVLDEGPGLDPGFARRAFDRFQRAPSAQQSSGSGLGLSIVKAVALAHAGAVGVGDGPSADFWLAIPSSD